MGYTNSRPTSPKCAGLVDWLAKEHCSVIEHQLMLPGTPTVQTTAGGTNKKVMRDQEAIFGDKEGVEVKRELIGESTE